MRESVFPLEFGPSPRGVLRLNERELLFGEAKQLRLAVGYILSPLAAVVAEKSGEGIDPIPETERLWLITVVGKVPNRRNLRPKGLLVKQPYPNNL